MFPICEKTVVKATKSTCRKQILTSIYRSSAYRTIPSDMDDCFSTKVMKTEKTFDILPWTQ